MSVLRLSIDQGQTRLSVLHVDCSEVFIRMTDSQVKLSFQIARPARQFAEVE